MVTQTITNKKKYSLASAVSTELILLAISFSTVLIHSHQYSTVMLFIKIHNKVISGLVVMAENITKIP